MLKYMEIRENYSISISHLCYRASRILGKRDLRQEELVLVRPQMLPYEETALCARKNVTALNAFSK